MSVSLDFLEILGRRKKNKISQGGVWADLTPPPFVTHVHKERIDAVDRKCVMNEFVANCDHRANIFATF